MHLSCFASRSHAGELTNFSLVLLQFKDSDCILHPLRAAQEFNIPNWFALDLCTSALVNGTFSSMMK